MHILFAPVYWAAISALAGVQTNAPDTDIQTHKYLEINELLIDGFLGRVTIIQSSDLLSFDIEGADAQTDDELRVRERTLIISGPAQGGNFNADREIDWALYENDAIEAFAQRQPKLSVRIPPNVTLHIRDMVGVLEIGDISNDISLDHGLINATIGDVRSLDIHAGDDGRITAGNIAQNLKIVAGGRAQFQANSATTAELSVGGSGAVDVNEIRGDAKIHVAGSGDVGVQKISGRVSAITSGSGDIEIGAVEGECEFSVAGSGDVTARHVSGPVRARISGNGDIFIADGMAENLKVAITGSGDFRFLGVSTNLEAFINGHGSVFVNANKGLLNTSGYGEFHIGENITTPVN